jgi:murein DD-endopeptidase MepM/ murein hydrolase activator NlpD
LKLISCRAVAVSLFAFALFPTARAHERLRENESPRPRAAAMAEPVADAADDTDHRKDVPFEPKPYGASEKVPVAKLTAHSLSTGSNAGTLIAGFCSWVNVGELRQLLYADPSFYRPGYIYTAVLESVSGDPDLYLHQRVNGTWYQVRRSWNSGAVVDSFTFTRADLNSSATNVDLDAKGYTAATFNFYLYEKSASTGFLEFPLKNGWTPYSATIEAVLDHSLTTGPNCADSKVVTYTNEVGLASYGGSSWSKTSLCSSSTLLRGFRNAAKTQFSVNGQYDRSANNEYGYYIFYDGHTGYDYPVPDGTGVYPAANGTAYFYPDGIRVDHPNGYSTYYLHLSQKYISDGQSVSTTTLIGRSGQGHLHFTVMKGGERADPYGWKGPVGQDPLKVDGQDNVCLWTACQ